LIIVYGYILSKGSAWIADGAELLIHVLPGPLVGGLILPVLGAVPDAAIILVSTLGATPEKVEKEVLVGVGTLAGSTIMLLTLPLWGTILLARTDIGPNGEALEEKCSRFKCKSFVKSGVTVTKDVRLLAIVVLLTMLLYLFIQIPGVIYASSPHSSEDEHYFALAACILCFLALGAYSVFMILFPRYPQKVLSIFRKKRNMLSVIESFRKELRREEIRPQRDALKFPLLVMNMMEDQHVIDHPLATPAPDPSAPAAPTARHREPLFAPMKRVHVSRDRLRNIGLQWLIKAKEKRVRRDYGIAEEGEMKNYEEAEEEAGAVPDGPLTVKQKLKIWLRAGFWLALGTATVAIFSDPMVSSITALSDLIDTSGQLQFYISFIITPIASNASELISALMFARKKKRKITSVSFSALLGAATMNNTLCLGIFLLMIFLKKLTWHFSAEVIPILVCELCVGLICLKQTFRFYQSFIFVLFYPITLGLVFLLKHVLK